MRKNLRTIISFVLVLACGLTSCQGIGMNTQENTHVDSLQSSTNETDTVQLKTAKELYFDEIDILDFEAFKDYIDLKDFLERDIEYLILPVKSVNQDTIIPNAEQILNDNIYISASWEPIHLEDIQWDEDPYENASWRLYFQALNFVSFLMRAYEVTGDLKYLSKAEYYIIDWIKKNPIDFESNSDYTWNDHAASSRAKGFIDFLHRYRESGIFDERNFELICYSLYQHGKYLSNDSNYVDSNHGLMQDQALLQIATIFSAFPDSEAWLSHALNRIYISTENHVTSEGVHREHSPFYHVFVQDMYVDIQHYLSTVGIYDETINSVILAMDQYVKNIVTPSGHYPLVSDTNLMVNPKANYDSTLEDKVYEKSGVAFFRSQTERDLDDIYMMFVAAYNSTYHKHKDELSFVLTINDTDYFIDGGHHGYNKSAERSLLLSPYAHNTIILDNKAWSFGEEMIGNPRIEKSFTSENLSYLRASHTMYDDVKISRTIIFIKPELIIIHDNIDSSNESFTSVQQIFNLGEDIDLVKNNEASYTLNSKNDNNFMTFNLINKGDYSTNIYSGNKEPYIGWATKIAGSIHPVTTMIFDYPLDKKVDIFSTISIGSDEAVSGIDYDVNHDSYSFSFNNEDYEIVIEQ